MAKDIFYRMAKRSTIAFLKQYIKYQCLVKIYKNYVTRGYYQKFKKVNNVRILKEAINF